MSVKHMIADTLQLDMPEDPITLGHEHCSPSANVVVCVIDDCFPCITVTKFPGRIE